VLKKLESQFHNPYLDTLREMYKATPLSDNSSEVSKDEHSALYHE
jgi:hypothetical protein